MGLTRLQFEYSFDDIGNRKQTKAGGDEKGANLRPASYTNNLANQIVRRDVPGYVDVLGVALATNSVTVNGQAAYRKGEYFRKEWNVDNISKAVWTNMSVASPGQSTVSGNRFLPKTNEVFAYDADGNLTNDGRWTYTWDGENRLVKMAVNTNVGPEYQLTFGYDAEGRRIRKVVATNGISIRTNKFVYDRWNLEAEVAPNNAVIRTYVWGVKPSDSPDSFNDLLELSFFGNAVTNCFPLIDGNANISGLIQSTDGTMAAIYEYGPFGEVIRATGPMAKANPFRFSTKYQDDETDLVMYPARPYNPSTGRFLTRDPAQELGGFNPYYFVENDPISHFDILGLWGEDVHYGRTRQWAADMGIQSMTAGLIASMDNAIDTMFDPSQLNDRNFSWHFNRSQDPNKDSRLEHNKDEVKAAKDFCTWSMGHDDAMAAAMRLGYSLHPLQDWVAHGDFDRWAEAPKLSIKSLHYWHNWDRGGWTTGWWTAHEPDDPNLDGDGADGRATFLSATMHLGAVLSNGDTTYWTYFHPGGERIRKTEQLTREELSDFKSFVAQNGKPCGQCWKAFLGGN